MQLRKKNQTSENKPSKIYVKRTQHTWVHKNAHTRGNKCIVVLPRIGTANKVFGYFSYWLLPLYSKWFCLISLQISLKDQTAQVPNISLQLLSRGISLFPLEEGNTGQISRQALSSFGVPCQRTWYCGTVLASLLLPTCFSVFLMNNWNSNQPLQHPNMCSSEWPLLRQVNKTWQLISNIAEALHHCKNKRFI